MASRKLSLSSVKASASPVSVLMMPGGNWATVGGMFPDEEEV
jgi:hypothetical protein